jgi:MHS family proline/betaine transporter-like MFS transporter
MRLSPKVVVSGVIGNTLENYDYVLYANFAVIISKMFFPAGDLYTSLIATFGVFAAGFLTRPIGALIFGHIGDKYSRKTALSFSIMLMSFPTSLIGLLPTYSEIGILAPLALVIIRMMQGISIGGETSGFMTYLMESVPNQKRKHLFGAIALSSTALGIFLGFVAVFICNFYFSDVEYAWRIPFLISLPVGIVGFYIRSKLDETPEFQKLKNKNLLAKSPFLELFKEHKTRFFVICGLFVSISVPFYIFFGFLATFLTKVIGYNQLQVSQIYLASSFAFIILPFLSGFLSDRFGVGKVLLFSILTFAALVLPIFSLILQPDFALTLSGCLLFIFVITLYQGSVPSLVTQIFPTKVRAIGTALSFNMISVIFGGFTPLVLTWLLKTTETNAIIPAYLIFSSLITITALIISNKCKIFK